MPKRIVGLLSLIVTVGCAGEEASTVASAPTVADSAAPSATKNREESGTRIAFLGDSLTAGLGLREDEAFPALVQTKLLELGWRVAVVNAGVSGDTTAGGRSRLSWLLRWSPDIVVVELGTNDGLRGLPIENATQNLREIVQASREAGAVVLLIGMRVPPNYGADYADRFAAIFPGLAAELEVAYMPFLLEGVGGVAKLNMADGIHPNAEGHRLVAASVVPHVEALLTALRERGRA